MKVGRPVEKLSVALFVTRSQIREQALSKPIQQEKALLIPLWQLLSDRLELLSLAQLLFQSVPAQSSDSRYLGSGSSSSSRRAAVSIVNADAIKFPHTNYPHLASENLCCDS